MSAAIVRRGGSACSSDPYGQDDRPVLHIANGHSTCLAALTAACVSDPRPLTLPCSQCLSQTRRRIPEATNAPNGAARRFQGRSSMGCCANVQVPGLWTRHSPGEFSKERHGRGSESPSIIREKHAILSPIVLLTPAASRVRM